MEIYEMTIHELRSRLKNKEISPLEIVESIFKRINQVEQKVKAFVSLNVEEAKAAKARDYSYTEGDSCLSGIPYGLKDSICTKGIKTTCSSRMLENYVPIYDATVARKLNESKGILIGKTNMDEFAMGSSTELSAFFPTYNPWDLTRVPGGSSGGSAAAVAAGEATFCLGSDTGGSIRQPASYCGIVGMKPTYGRVSRWGVVSLASSLDQVGVLSKDVEDCALVMNVIAGYDSMDSNSVKMEVPDYTSFLDNDVKGMKIAYPREYFQAGVDNEVKAGVEAALKKYEELGAIIEEVSLPHSQYALPAYCIILPAEASANMGKYDGVRYGLRDFEAENIVDMFCRSRSRAFGDEVKRRIMLGTFALSSGYYDAYYNKALKVRRLILNDFENVFKNYDLIISPTTPTTAFKIGENAADPLVLYMNDVLTVPINLAGLPGISIPCGLAQGLPIGMQIIAPHFQEGLLIKAAYAFEQATGFHLMKPTLGVE
ncbi:MAG: Asp-tRNA(Asn)/Glu-tRNA(Gln) amidotransferase subunit GatA [Syntrophomonadaceae bacterium]